MIPFARVLNYGNVLAKIEIVDIVTSYGNVFVIYSDGKAYGMGDNGVGELGQGNTLNNYRDVWAEMSVPNIKNITCSRNTTLMITTNNTVYMCGSNFVFNSNTNVLTPIDITARFSTFNLAEDEVLCASQGIFVLRANGDLYACGQGTNTSGNQNGNCGVGTAASVNFKLVASNVKNVYTSISASSEASFYVSRTGELYSTGRNGSGACGIGYVGEIPTFTKVNTVFDSAISGIFCANSTSAICTINGTVYSCGARSGGQYGDGMNGASASTTFIKNNAVTIPNSLQYAKSFHNNDGIYITNTSAVWCAGADYYGQFGFGNTSYTVYWTYTALGSIDPSNFRSGGYFNYTWSGNKVYACGNSMWIPGRSTNTGVYIQVPVQPRVL